MFRAASHLCALCVGWLISFLGCTVGGLDPTGKNCPCPEGFVCDEQSKTCVSEGSGTGASGPSSTSSSSTSTMGSGGASGCSGVCGTPGCGTCPDVPVVAVDAYDIDATEATAGSYQAFLDTNPTTAGQPSYCLWNETFAVVNDDPRWGCDKPFDPVTFPLRPITCVDWCDALAYCTWAKRRLCGRIGGGKLQQEQAADPDLSEWQRACSNAGTQAYPYGPTYVEQRCNTSGYPSGGTTVDVGSAIDCVGGYRGLLDMSGNAEEWEDACGTGVNPDDPSDDSCVLRGGAYWTEEAESRCDSIGYAAPRDGVSQDWAVRCCGPAQ